METIRNNKFGAMILPDGKYYSLDDMETRLNNNVIIVGTTGSSKTRTVITPNLLECVGSYVVTDPKGNLCKQWGRYMEERGYRVVRISFIHPEESIHYNPLKYVKTSQEIQKLSCSLINSRKGGNPDPFWDDSALMLMNSILGYLKEAFNEGASIHNAMKLLRMSGRDESSCAETGLSLLMEEHHRNNPNSWAYKQFQNVNQAPDRTFNSIVATAVAKLSSIDTEELEKMMGDDQINLPSIGMKKTVVFVEVSDSDRSMDVLINTFFTQTMNQLCSFADECCTNNQLPVPVRFFMDDFATNCKIDNFENMISNIRSRKISVMIVLQSLSQLENSYEHSAHTIIDDCDTMIYMGGNDPETAHSIAIRCDKTTQTILHMPLCTSWIFRRGTKPFSCKNMELEEYLRMKNIFRKNELHSIPQVLVERAG